MTKIKVEFESVEEMKEFCDTFGNSIPFVQATIEETYESEKPEEGDCSDNIIQNRCEAEKKEEAATKDLKPESDIIRTADREAIKARLRVLNVEFKEAARTPTLFKLLQEAEKTLTEATKEALTEATKEALTEATKEALTEATKEALIEPSSQVVTKKTVMEELQKLIAKDENRMTRAREILKINAGVEVFADVKEEFYLKVFEACQEALKKEALK